MAEPTAPAKSLKSLGGIKRKAVDLSAVSLVKSEVFAGHSSPLVFEPTAEVELAAWAQNNLPELDAKLREHGAILFRGFGLKDPTDFERVAAAIAGGLYGEYGDLPREGVADRVYTSTPYPEDKSILYHNESSHMARWPMKIFFFCVTAAKEGGATPIVDCREVYKSLDPKVRRLFEEKGLLYVRNFSEGLDVSWQHFFKTDDKSVVEKSCGAVGMDCEWRENNGLSIRQRCQAVAHHPVTGEPTFFNQVQLHHVYCLDSVVRESVMSIFKERDLPRHVYFGDGSTIEPAVMDHVGEIYEKHAVRFQWQAGDLIMLDNMITAHARDPFVGPRKIVVAMGQMMSADELSKTVAAKA